MTAFFSTRSDLQSRFDLFKTLQQAARDITLPLFDNPQAQQVENKAAQGYDPVTEADMGAEKVLREIILKHFPDDHITGEEFDDVIGTNEFGWTLDPIDGTRAFVAGVPVWSTLIALSYKGEPIIGMIDLPALARVYIGAPDKTGNAIAYRGEDDGSFVPIKSAPCPELKQAILGCTEPLAMFKPGELAAYNIIRAGARFSRLGLDALSYGLLSEGRMNIVIEAALKPCDVRALMPIIVGAGGAITNWHGGTAVDGGRVVAVGDKTLLPEIYTYLGRALD